MSDQSTPVTRLPLRKGASLRWLPFLFIFLQSVLYGLGDPISKSAYEVLPVYSLLTARYGIALAFLLLVFGRRIWRGLKVCSPRDWLLPSLCMGGAYVANNIALELTAATSVAFLRSLSTVMTPLLALAFYRRKFGKKHIPVQLLSCGALPALRPGRLSGFGLGEVFSLLSALLLAGPDFWRARPGPGGPRHPHHPPDRRLSPHGPCCAPWPLTREFTWARPPPRFG